MVPDIIIKFELGGSRYTLNFRKVPLTTWSQLKARPGFTPGSLIDGLETADLEAYASVIWLERRQRDRKVPFSTVWQELESEPELEFEIVDVVAAGKSLFGVEDEEETEEDPTTAG